MKQATTHYRLMVTVGKRDQAIRSLWFGQLLDFNTGDRYKTLKSAKAALKQCQKHESNKSYPMWIEKVTTTIERIG
ncbi:hypothetical protein LCGC14_2080310 [marine sediment metagenome]|uniref:Uncharacterized protein n=1 Tax=marine sediment metagenome TaxID=412755 RepID=A0A0F9EG23_9ZZZZ